MKLGSLTRIERITARRPSAGIFCRMVSVIKLTCAAFAGPDLPLDMVSEVFAIMILVV